MLITLTGDRYVARSTYAERTIPSAAGFRWDKAAKVWWTNDASKAAQLAEYADDTCRENLAALAERRDTALTESRAAALSDMAVHIDVPAPNGLTYLPYQEAGIAYASQRPSTLIADEMGLGKTIQAIGMLNLDPSAQSVLVVCPASLRLNWKRELEKWLVRPLTVGIAASNRWPDTQVVICNYDILHKFVAILAESQFDLAVVDEAHYCKNAKTRRAKAAYSIRAKRRAFLTGTPIVNRPSELFPIINALDPITWPKFFPFARRYCNAHHNGFGWDFSGAANLEELQDKLRATIMVRRLKKDVLTDLPPKRRQVIEITDNSAANVVAAEREAWAAKEARIDGLRAQVELAKAESDLAYTAAVKALAEGAQAAFSEMARLRHDTAVAKVPYVLEHLNTIIEEGEAKVVLFAHHHDVVNAIRRALGDTCVVLTGETPMAERQAAVDRFQTDPTCQVFVGSIHAAGVGLTLTAAAHVVFAELDWVQGNVTQAEDRCHRIGQTNSVLVQHLVLEGSLDATMARTLVEKQDVIDRALDSTERAVREAIIVPTKDEAATQTVKREQIEAEAATLAPEQIAAIHAGIQMLSAMCDGAQSIDGAGFSKIDTHVGHSLAKCSALSPKQAVLGKRLCSKYRRQLPEGLLEQINAQQQEAA